MDIQAASSSIDQYLIADSSAMTSAGRESASARESEPDQVSAPAEEPTPASAEPARPITPGVYARNARPVAMRMSSPSISFLA